MIDHSILGDYTIFSGVGFSNLEFDCSHSTTDEEGITLADWSISFVKVWFEIYVKDVPAETLDRVVEWEDMDAFTVFDVEALMYMDEVPEFDSQVVASDLVHLDATFAHVI